MKAIIKPIIAMIDAGSGKDEVSDTFITVGFGLASGVAVDTIVDCGVVVANIDLAYADEVL
jgi:hypothetical protein